MVVCLDIRGVGKQGGVPGDSHDHTLLSGKNPLHICINPTDTSIWPGPGKFKLEISKARPLSYVLRLWLVCMYINNSQGVLIASDSKY